MSGVQWVVAALGGLGGLAGIAALLNAFFGRGKTRAEAAQILTGTAVTLVNELEEATKAHRADAVQARAETAQARADTAQAREELRTVREQVRDELNSVRDQARSLAEELHQLRTTAMRPGATIEGVREFITHGGANGRAVL